MFYTILEFNIKPLPKHLNAIMQILLARRSFLRPAFDLFKSAHRYQGLCRRSQVNRAVDLLEDMLNKGFVPDALRCTTLLNSLCRKKQHKESYKLLCRMKVKGCHPDIVHYNTVILDFCGENRALDACKVLEDMPSNRLLVEMLRFGEAPHMDTWVEVVTRICEVEDEIVRMEDILKEVLKVEIKPHTRIIEAGVGLEEYVIRKIQAASRKF